MLLSIVCYVTIAVLLLLTLSSVAQSGSRTVDGLATYFYFQLFPLLPIIVATTGNVRRAGQLELCGNSAAHTCTAARDAASGISFACCTRVC